MAPSYRNANRRQNRPGVDHGEYEGIPIRHWRRDLVTVAPPPTPESTTSQNDIWAVELPHGMPKDFHLLPQHSQDLLRAARSGKIYKRPAPADEEEPDPEIIIGDKLEKKDDDVKEKGFTAKSWKQVARHLEGPDVVYLAKRRRGLVTAASRPLPVPTVTKATVKRIDAAGNEYVQDIVVPQGQVVEGEVLSQTQIPDPNAPVGSAPVHATPPRPRPKSKKKSKGPGRGRKKKPAAPTSAPQVPLAEGVAPLPTIVAIVEPVSVKVESEPSLTPTLNEDTEMGDGSAVNSDDEDGEDGEDGDEGDDDDGSVDVQDSPSRQSQQSPSAASAPLLPPIPTLEQADFPMGGTELSPVPPRLLTDRFEAKSRSPLRKVAMTTSTLTSPLHPPAISSPTKASPNTHPLVSDTPLETKLESLDAEMQRQVPVLAPESLPLPPPEPTIIELVSAVEERDGEEEEEEMLPDILDRAKNAEIGAPLNKPAAFASPAHRNPPAEAAIVQPDPTPQADAAVEPAQAIPEPKVMPEATRIEDSSLEIKQTPNMQESIPNPTAKATPKSTQELLAEASTQEPPIDDDYDDFDLLGGLEKSLKIPEARVETPIAVAVSEEDPEDQAGKSVEKAGIEGEVTPRESQVAEPNSQESDMML